LQLSRWVYLAACAALVAVCIVRYVRGTLAGTYLLVMVLLAAFLLYEFFGVTGMIKRLKNVSFTVTDEGVSGVSFANIKRRDAANPEGEAFSLAWGEVKSAAKGTFEYTRRQPAWALVLETAEKRYVLPSLENIEEMLALIRAHIEHEA